MFVSNHNHPNKELTITKLQSTVKNNIAESQYDAPLNYTEDQNLDTPIHSAVKQNQREIVEQLVKREVDVNVRGKDRKTPLHLSVARNLPAITKLLLEHGADTDLKDINGKTPLHYACWRGNLESLNELLYYGADVNAEDNFQATPLMLTQKSNNTWIKLQHHVVKLRAADMPVSERNENYIKKFISQDTNYVIAAELRQFENAAVEETLRMEKVSIAVRVSLADVLQMSTIKLSVFKSNEDFQKLLHAQDFEKKYPIYGDLVRACYRRGVVRSDQVSSAKDAFRKILGLALPDVCCDAIFHCLDNENLDNLKKSAEMKITKRELFVEESYESVRVKGAKRINV